jgi:3-deoxy-D-manno-octulosonic acid kinase
VSTSTLPPGYLRSAQGSVELVARDWASGPLCDALRAHGTLFHWAESQADRETLHGRGIAWATTITAPDATPTPVVVRHSRHGGMLAGVTGDLFLRPTRAPHELSAAVRLSTAGVATPEVIAYAVHPVAGAFARSDVMTRRLPPGRDFPAAWSADASPESRQAIIDAVATLLRALSAAGAHHADINIKNVYIAGTGTAATAFALDVDRVSFGGSANAAAQNFARFARSVRKWNALHSLGVGDDALVRLASLAWVDS